MKLLLSPLPLASIELRNRVVSTAHDAFADFYRPGVSGERYISYQEARARGGTGLIISQPTHVHHTSQEGHGHWDRDDLASKFRELAERLHRHGTRVVAQLIHYGVAFRSDANSDLEPLWGFSPILSVSGGEPAHEMTPADIEEVIDGYADTAQLVVECGLDGVELHGAHGYLIQQSMSPWANQRTDEWGDPHRFSQAVVECVRSRIGSEPVVGVRLSVDDWTEPERGGIGPEGAREAARMFVSTGGIDYINTSGGAQVSHYTQSIGSYRYPDAPLLSTVAELRAAIDTAVPVIGVSRIMTPQRAEQALEDGACDLVGMTRAQIADPELVRKIEQGRFDAIRPCVGVNQGCVNRALGGGLPITCFHNPDVGREYRLDELKPEGSPWRVLVVGAGPAGLKAAEIAARRGHDVTLVDRGPELGGRLRWVARCGPAAEILRSIFWIGDQLDQLRVDVRLDVEADEDLLSSAAPDAVVLATGARSMLGGLPAGDGSVPIVSIEDALTRDCSGSRVLVFDQLGLEEVALAAEGLADAGASVTLVTPLRNVGANIGFTLIRDQIDRLNQLGCRLEASTTLVGVSRGEAETQDKLTKATRQWPVDLIVAGVAGQPDLSLKHAAESVARQVEVAGDAVAPRTAMHAFREGDAAGRAVGARARDAPLRA